MKTKIKLSFGFIRAWASIMLLGLAVLAGAPLIDHRAASAQVAVPGQPLVPLGYCQLASIDTAVGLASCSGGIPTGATYAIITAEAQAVRWRDDAVNPTTAVGMPVAVGAPFFYAGTLSGFRVIASTAGAKLDVSFYR